MMYNCHPNFTNEELSPAGESNLPRSWLCRATRSPTRSGLRVSRAHGSSHQRDKEIKDAHSSSNCEVNVRATGLSMSFCFFLSLYPNLTEIAEIILRTQVFNVTQLRTNHVWDVVGSVLISIIVRKSWNTTLPSEDSSLLVRDKEPVGSASPCGGLSPGLERM